MRGAAGRRDGAVLPAGCRVEAGAGSEGLAQYLQEARERLRRGLCKGRLEPGGDRGAGSEKGRRRAGQNWRDRDPSAGGRPELSGVGEGGSVRFRGGSGAAARPARPSPPQAFVHAAQVPTVAVAVLILHLRLPRRLHGRGGCLNRRRRWVRPPGTRLPEVRPAGRGQAAPTDRAFPPAGGGTGSQRLRAPGFPAFPAALTPAWHLLPVRGIGKARGWPGAPRCHLFAWRPGAAAFPAAACRPAASSQVSRGPMLAPGAFTIECGKPVRGERDRR